MPNEIKGTLLTQSGAPAVNAQVVLYKVDYAPGDNADPDSGRFESKTNAAGVYSFKDVPDGTYNLVGSGNGSYAFKDSLSLEGGENLGRDTLRAPGSLAGRIVLQPQHDPRTAVVEVLGTNYFTNVDSAGGFRLDSLPQGKYRLRVSVTVAGYTPLFRGVAIASGVFDTLTEALEPFYSGVHTVTGIVATPDTLGMILLRWNKTRYAQLQTYNVYRAPLGSSDYTLLGKTTDTTFIDTIFSPAYGRAPTGNQYPFTDTTTRIFAYRVRIENQSGALGPYFGGAAAGLGSPARRLKSGRWHLAAAQSSIAALGSLHLVIFKEKLWAFGNASSGKVQAWSSVDGLAWTLMKDSIPASSTFGARAAAFRDTLWLSGAYSRNNVFTNFLLKSADGVQWTVASDNFLPVFSPKPSFSTGKDSSRENFAFLEFQNKLWVLGGSSSSYGHYLKSTQYASANGSAWSEVAIPKVDSCCLATSLLDGRKIAVHDGKMWAAGGWDIEGSTNYSMHSADVWSSADGANWNKVAAAPAPLPRFGHALQAHGGFLWILGGYAGHTTPSGGTTGGGIAGGTVTNQAWRSPDGVSWEIVDLYAPFSPRSEAVSVSFKGKLWVFGGGDNVNYVGSPAPLSDVWYYE